MTSQEAGKQEAMEKLTRKHDVLLGINFSLPGIRDKAEKSECKKETILKSS
jgi:hypothetical protein